MPSVLQPAAPPSWANIATAWLTPRRLRAQAIVLALCLWGVFAFDYATPGPFDRAGNIKFQDFLPFYVSARLVAQNRARDLYDQQASTDEMQTIIQQPLRVRLPNLYGPQVALMFVPLTFFSFAVAARIWVTLSLFIYFSCIYVLWKSCRALRAYSGIVAISSLAFPPLFHFFARGQISVLALACFTASFVTLRSGQDWMAGFALGLLVFKPQFLIAIPFVLLLSHAWKAFAGLALSAALQLFFTTLYFGLAVMRTYIETLCHTSRWIDVSELSLAPIQMHSLRSFWVLLVSWPRGAFAFYILSSCVAIALATIVFRSSVSLALRFSALTLAAVLVNPHLFIYDLLVVAPVLMLLADWSVTHATSSAQLRLLLYLTFTLPLLGPLSQWTHLQLSVPAFAILLWTLWRISTSSFATQGHKLDSIESHVV